MNLNIKTEIVDNNEDALKYLMDKTPALIIVPTVACAWNWINQLKPSGIKVIGLHAENAEQQLNSLDPNTIYISTYNFITVGIDLNVFNGIVCDLNMDLSKPMSAMQTARLHSLLGKLKGRGILLERGDSGSRASKKIAKVNPTTGRKVLSLRK